MLVYREFCLFMQIPTEKPLLLLHYFDAITITSFSFDTTMHISNLGGVAQPTIAI